MERKTGHLHALQPFLCKIARGRKASLFQAPKILGTKKMKPKTNQPRANAEINVRRQIFNEAGTRFIFALYSFQYFAGTGSVETREGENWDDIILTSISSTPYSYPLRSIYRQTHSWQGLDFEGRMGYPTFKILQSEHPTNPYFGQFMSLWSMYYIGCVVYSWKWMEVLKLIHFPTSTLSVNPAMYQNRTFVVVDSRSFHAVFS